MGLTGVANVYGISEASPNVTIADADDPPAMRQTCGRPHSGTEVRIVALDGGTAPAGESGLIEVRGPCVMKGYLDDPEQTAATVSADGWLTTGDRGHLDADGNLVYEGRAKDMLRVGGENVAPAEIEAVLLAHPELAAAAVVGVPHDRLVEVPAAFVVPHPGRAVSPEQVTEHVAQALAPHKVPRLVIVTDELPMTGSGKVRKHQLAERARTHVVA
jgi:acyl-CoA synthetase (AMP-forming)/AMP-acid ligase II